MCQPTTLHAPAVATCSIDDSITSSASISTSASISVSASAVPQSTLLSPSASSSSSSFSVSTSVPQWLEFDTEDLHQLSNHTANQFHKNQKSVRFEQDVRVRWIAHRDDEDFDKEQVYYNRQDVRQFRKQSREYLQSIEQHKSLVSLPILLAAVEAESHQYYTNRQNTLRGLEGMTKIGRYQKRHLRMTAIHHVLQEQEQLQKNYYNSSPSFTSSSARMMMEWSLADVYAPYSRQACITAMELARIDQEQVIQQRRADQETLHQQLKLIQSLAFLDTTNTTTTTTTTSYAHKNCTNSNVGKAAVVHHQPSSPPPTAVNNNNTTATEPRHQQQQQQQRPYASYFLPRPWNALPVQPQQRNQSYYHYSNMVLSIAA